MKPELEAVAFAPASVGNVAVGFDVLGYSASVAGDRVRVVEPADRGFQSRSVPRVQDQSPPETVQLVCEGPTQPLGRAGDHGDLGVVLMACHVRSVQLQVDFKSSARAAEAPSDVVRDTFPTSVG